MAGQWNFEVWAGDTFEAGLTIWTDNTQTTPVNLTGCTAVFQAWDDAHEILFTLDTETNGGITIDGVQGVINLTGPVISELPGCNNYRLVVTFPTGQIITYLVGAFQIKASGPSEIPSTELPL